jgi:PAS domain S-box-containing protein
MLGNVGSQLGGTAADVAPRLLSQLMISNLPDAIYVKDERRRFVCLNEAECRILGATKPADVVGKTADRFVPAKRARTWRQEDARVLVSGEVLLNRIEQAVDEDGNVRWLSATKAPLRNRGGAISGIVGITRDITKEKVGEHAKDQFISTLSHELRTPVAAIIGSLSLVTSGAAGTIPEDAERLLRIASANGQRLISLINDILDLEKLTCGMMVFDLLSIDVLALLEREIAAMQAFAEPYGVRIRLEGDAIHAKVRADPVRLAQVVINLLSNAIKYSPRGAEVVVGLEERRGIARIWVRDHGPGIPVEFRDRVFDKFVQVGAGRTGPKCGTGLGLSIAKEIVERLHGKIGFELAPDGGTIFEVRLPSLDGASGEHSDCRRAIDGESR